MQYDWTNITEIRARKYECGYCGSLVSPNKGYQSSNRPPGRILICPNCSDPTFIAATGEQTPSVRLGRNVNGVTDTHVLSAYNEARDCTSVGAYTGAVLLCRKLLMNIAVHQGAKVGEPFTKYIDYLESNGYIPPNGKDWVDEIRKKGNIATHDIPVMSPEDASQLLNFVEMLLRFIYEFPSMIKEN